jgi:hypothetical protein
MREGMIGQAINYLTSGAIDTTVFSRVGLIFDVGLGAHS